MAGLRSVWLGVHALRRTCERRGWFGWRTLVATGLAVALAGPALVGCDASGGQAQTEPQSTVQLSPKDIAQISQGKAEQKKADATPDNGTSKGTDGQPTADLPNLDHVEDADAISAFLSELSQAGLGHSAGGYDYAFDRQTSGVQDWADLAVRVYLLEGGRAQNVRAPMGHGMSEKYGDKCVSCEDADKVAQRVCGKSYGDWEGLEQDKSPYRYDASASAICWKRDYQHEQYGPSVATGTTASDDGLLHVNFDAYDYDDGTTHYSMMSDNVETYNTHFFNKLLRVEGPNAHGVAVLECTRTDDGWQFHLVSYALHVDS